MSAIRMGFDIPGSLRKQCHIHKDLRMKRVATTPIWYSL